MNIGDATKLSRLSCRVGGVNTTADKTRQFCLVHVGGVNRPRVQKSVSILIEVYAYDSIL